MLVALNDFVGSLWMLFKTFLKNQFWRRQQDECQYLSNLKSGAKTFHNILSNVNIQITWHKQVSFLTSYYEGTSKSFRTLFLKNLYVTDMRTTLLFNIISLLLDTFSPAICKLLNAVGKESLWLTVKPVMHRLFHLIISCKSMTS